MLSLTTIGFYLFKSRAQESSQQLANPLCSYN